jgi:hypothetical protein
MLSPCEIVRRDSAGASLLCAVTPVRRAPVDAVQIDAKRDSFSRGYLEYRYEFLTLMAWVRANSLLKRV